MAVEEVGDLTVDFVLLLRLELIDPLSESLQRELRLQEASVHTVGQVAGDLLVPDRLLLLFFLVFLFDSAGDIVIGLGDGAKLATLIFLAVSPVLHHLADLGRITAVLELFLLGLVLLLTRITVIKLHVFGQLEDHRLEFALFDYITTCCFLEYLQDGLDVVTGVAGELRPNVKLLLEEVHSQLIHQK